MPVLFHLNGDAVAQPGVDFAVGLYQGLSRVLEQAFDGLVVGFGGQFRVQARERVTQAGGARMTCV